MKSTCETAPYWVRYIPSAIVNYVQSFKNVSVYSFNTNGLHPEASMKNQSSSIYLQIYTERSNAISVSLLSDGKKNSEDEKRKESFTATKGDETNVDADEWLQASGREQVTVEPTFVTSNDVPRGSATE
ncbi:hypothetical protein YC2023_058263 [Brassica napus]